MKRIRGRDNLLRVVSNAAYAYLIEGNKNPRGVVLIVHMDAERAWSLHIIGCSHHYNTGRTKQLVCYHSLFTLSSGYNVTNIRLLCNPAIGKEKKNRSVIGKGVFK